MYIISILDIWSLEDTIKQIETCKMTLVLSLRLVEEAVKNIKQIYQSQGPQILAIKEKMNSVLTFKYEFWFTFNKIKQRCPLWNQ